MKDLYEAIAERLKPMRASDNVQTIDIWNNQTTPDDKGKHGKKKGIRYNAIYMAFQIAEVRHIGLGVKDKVTNVRFYFAIKKLKADKRDNLDFYTNFAQLIESWASDGVSLPVFGSFKETEAEFDEDHDLVALPYLDYQTVYRDVSGYRFLKGRQVQLGTITVEKPTIQTP